MSSPTHFLQSCPTCGRSLEVRVEHLGRRVTCQHCHGTFVATHSDYALSPRSSLLRRAEELIELAQRQHYQRL